MKPVFSSPCLADGKLFFGEGMHSDRDCRLFCLDVASGGQVWSFQTRSHVESSPVVSDGSVFFGAGDDGLFCLDTMTGKANSHFEGLHVDANPAVHSGRVFAGSTAAAGNEHVESELFALDAATGQPIWRVPVDLSSFARPSVFDGAVFFGLHSGDFETPAAKPAGAVVCLDAESGKQTWRKDLPDGVFTQPLVDRDAVVVGCRDGNVYSLDRNSGEVRWQVQLGSPILASLASVRSAERLAAIYAVSRDGKLARLDPSNGRATWSLNVVRDADDMKAKVLSSPVVVEESAGRRIYQAVTLSNALNEQARVYCFSDDD